MITKFLFQTLIYNTVVQQRLFLATFTIFYLSTVEMQTVSKQTFTLLEKKPSILTIHDISTTCGNACHFVHESPQTLKSEVGDQSHTVSI